MITGITEHGLLDQMALARATRPDGEPWTLDDCARMIAGYFDQYPEVKAYIDDSGVQAAVDGWVADKWGRIRPLPGIWSNIPAVKAEAGRQASSHRIQAGAQGWMKIAMKKVWDTVCKEAALDTFPMLQVHDELILECPDDDGCCTVVDEMVKDAMEGTLDQGVPVKAEGGFGYSWKEAH